MRDGEGYFMTTASRARTFAVSDVPQATEPLAETAYHQAIKNFLLTEQLESCSRYYGRLLSRVRSHPLIAALHAGFVDHRPVCISPDIIWITVAQGLAHHINMNAASLRHHFVRHGTKLKIVIRREDFIKGSPENPWQEAFSEFSSEIQKYLRPKAHGLVVANFSTTGSVELAASEIVLLDSMHAFFCYEFETVCGIPSITLEGTVQDWESIATRVENFRRFDLAWWVDSLKPILDQFIAAANGEVDRIFWDSIYKRGGKRGSGNNGSSPVTGWIRKLFPYVYDSSAREMSYAFEKFHHSRGEHPSTMLRRNAWLDHSLADEDGPGPKREDFPGMPARAPFVWKYLDHEFNMAFVGGLIGVRQAPDTLTLRPEIGWAVLDTSDERATSDPTRSPAASQAQSEYPSEDDYF